MQSPIRTSLDSFTFPQPPTHLRHHSLLASNTSTPPYTPNSPVVGASHRTTLTTASDFPLHSTPTPVSTPHTPHDFKRNNHILTNLESPIDPFFRSNSNTPLTPGNTVTIGFNFRDLDRIPKDPGTEHRPRLSLHTTSQQQPLQQQQQNLALEHLVGLGISDDDTLNLSDRALSPSSQVTIMPHASTTAEANPRQALERSYSDDSIDSYTASNKPKSPTASKFGAFFGWRGSPATSFSSDPESDRPLSTKIIPAALDIPRANAAGENQLQRTDSGVSMDYAGIYQDIEEELRYVSADLAASIRREMELEDIVERLQSQMESSGRLSPGNRRTSDYFSDAGAYSSSYDGDASKTELDFEKIVRKGEQEKAQLRLEMLQKLQDERSKLQDEQIRRKDVESHLQQLQNQTSTGGSPGQIRLLETSIEEARRKLTEERNLKENFEELLAALREELEEHRNERDNLRDEIVPQLKARVEGLEAEAAELQKTMYDHSRMQQEIDLLRTKNDALMETHRQILEMRSQQERLIASPQLAAPATPTSGATTPTFKDKESLLEKVKDVEAQRDALQQALKNLRMRNTLENKKAADRIKALEVDRDNASKLSPRRGRNGLEVSALRSEIDLLRKRAEEALDAKYVVEQGLSSLKLDLERAEQETDVLRRALQDQESLAMERDTTQRESQLQIEDSMLTAAALQEAMIQLKQIASQAKGERDEAIEEADSLRQRNAELQQEQVEAAQEEQSLSEQLHLSATRVEELALQVRQQLESNQSIRKRLAGAVSRGEQDQIAANEKINSLQAKLATLEESVMVAQKRIEDSAAENEQELNDLRESHSTQLRRMKTSLMVIPSTRSSTLRSPLGKSPIFRWSPQRASERAPSPSGELKSHMLEQRVKQLEAALHDADEEMEEVISKLNVAQIETAELRNERDDALQQTRRLHAQIDAQHSKYVQMMQ